MARYKGIKVRYYMNNERMIEDNFIFDRALDKHDARKELVKLEKEFEDIMCDPFTDSKFVCLGPGFSKVNKSKVDAFKFLLMEA